MEMNRTDVLHINNAASGKALSSHRLKSHGYVSGSPVLGHLSLQGDNKRDSLQDTPIVDTKQFPPFLMSDKSIRVLVMDDAPVVRQLIVDLLEDLSGVDLVLEAVDAPSAVAMATREEPQISILDIKVPGAGPLRNGIDVLRYLKKMQPAMKIIMLTNHATPRYKAECMSAGASYFFDKSNEFDELPLVVEELVRGLL